MVCVLCSIQSLVKSVRHYSGSKMTPSCKWPIRSMKVFYGLKKGRKTCGDGAGLTVENVRLSIATS